MSTIGTCSICGGPVQIPDVWWGTNPPVPQCTACGARPRQPHGPIIPMEKTFPIGPDVGWPLPDGPTCTGKGHIQENIESLINQGKLKPIQ